MAGRRGEAVKPGRAACGLANIRSADGTAARGRGCRRPSTCKPKRRSAGVADQDISDEAVAAATGRTWPQWFALLTEWGAGELSHQQIAQRIFDNTETDGWWSQMVTVRYEQHIGRRVPGQTHAGDYQTSVSRTVPGDVDAAWEAVLGAPWMGPAARWEEGASFDADCPVEVRAVKPAKMLRFWRHAPSGRSTVEVDFQPRASGTAVRFREHKMASEDLVAPAKERWSQALDVIAGHLDS